MAREAPQTPAGRSLHPADGVVGLSTTEAASAAGISEQQAWRWCVRDGIGCKVGGRWVVDPERLRRRAEAYFTGLAYHAEAEAPE